MIIIDEQLPKKDKGKEPSTDAGILAVYSGILTVYSGILKDGIISISFFKPFSK